jgi:16S rRNA (cytosine967-C5)-methyltransferase
VPIETPSASSSRTDGDGGLGPRRLAWSVALEILGSRTALDDAFALLAKRASLSHRDEALARAIVTVLFRRFGTIRRALDERLAKGWPNDERLAVLLATGAAQILFLEVPDHAAVDVTVRVAASDRRLQPFAGLVNAVLRRLARERDPVLRDSDALRDDTPPWLGARWTAHFGEPVAFAVAEAHRRGAALDLTAREDPQAWAERLGGIALPTGSVRLPPGGPPVRELAGYGEGAWWVQDAAAALPVRLLAPRPGERIADLCAAPGGKTAQLASAGARVLAVDRSVRRLKRLSDNMARLGLAVETLAEDARSLPEEPAFDAVLLDAPCTATGTIRRHPEVAWTKRETDLGQLGRLQRELLDKAAALVRPGGRLFYCVCSLEPEEGADQASAFRARHPAFSPMPMAATEVAGLADLLTGEGDLRTLPCHEIGRESARGLDGFFGARWRRESA